MRAKTNFSLEDNPGLTPRATILSPLQGYKSYMVCLQQFFLIDVHSGILFLSS